MPQVINTNMASLNAQRNLNASQSQANTALERLSSGLRINSAKDDAAGLAISERFQSQISGLNVAQRNANDGISLAQTAEGAMDEITNNLQRIRELAVQSANATNSISDRQALNQEVQQRIEEINRIASQTSFNGLKVLDGTFNTQTFQVGANAGETIGISGLDSRGSTIGSTLIETEGFANSAIGTGNAVESTVDLSGTFALDGTEVFGGTITINGASLTIPDSAYNATDNTLAASIQTAISNASGADATALSGISTSDDGSGGVLFTNSNSTDIATSFNLQTNDASSISSDEPNIDASSGAASDDGNYNIAGHNFTNGGTLTVGGENYAIAAGATGTDIANQLQGIFDTTGVTVTFADSAANTFDIDVASGQFDPPAVTIEANDGTARFSDTPTLFGADGDSFNFEVNLNGDTFTFNNVSSLGDIVSQVNAQTNTTGIRANLNSDNDEIIFSSQFSTPFSVDITGDLDDDGNFGSDEDLSITVNTSATDNYSIDDVDISTRDGADLALISLDYAIDTINGYRAELGAVQNRFESTIANLSTTSENLSASNSRIRDADFAAETAELARTQVLQSAGLSVLAQANARPQQVLQLLQG
ncbi:flagellin [Marinobacter sp.]|uniref:flagellin N-terminal helical domain-containing protein n=1 Tax=Marinobacter sp. TaxID=50741 RepID=UPI002B26F2C9|nr:flagellin [Marinobacter sp.]